MAEDVLVAEDKYDGKYVALRSFTDREVVASGSDPVAVMNAAKDRGAANPVLFFVPKRDMTFVY